MLRRDLLRAMAGAAALGFIPRSAEAATAFGERIHGSLARGSADFRTLDAAQQALVSRLCDRILPATDTPGALDVKVPEFIDLLLTEWFSDADRHAFLVGLGEIDARAKVAGAERFVGMADNAQLVLMRALDGARSEPSGAGATFGRLKSLTVFGFFTSERVTKEVLKTRIVFRSYDGCAPVTS